MKLNPKRLMPPPWLACPKIERYSIGWRMGYGEDYLDRFRVWLESLSTEEQMEYRTLFPEPVTWRGWWGDDETGELWEHGDFVVELWQPNGQPKYDKQWLQQEIQKGNTHSFCMFWGHQPAKDGHFTQSCFSQWWQSEFWSVAHTYCCMEQYMMASKARLFGDEEILEEILNSRDPKQIKALGRKVKGFQQNLWDQVKYSIVLNGNWCKFSQNQELQEFLLSTGDSILVEASPYDRIWGIGLSAHTQEAGNPLQWKGQNLLGFALMEVRDELKRVTQNGTLCDWNTV